MYSIKTQTAIFFTLNLVHAMLIYPDYSVMTHVQKPVFVSQLNGQVHLFWMGVIFQSAIGSQGVRISLHYM
jgi:hypothetical protein